MAWTQKLKSLFITDEAPQSNLSIDAEQEASQEQLALGEPSNQEATLQAPKDAEASINFRSLYEQAGVLDTGEVEMLEKFLGELEPSLPQAIKVTSAKAFLKAINKSPEDVFRDAALKLKVVRALQEAKTKELNAQTAKNQQEIDALQKKIDTLREANLEAHQQIEALKARCSGEEARLQAARLFFGEQEKPQKKS